MMNFSEQTEALAITMKTLSLNDCSNQKSVGSTSHGCSLPNGRLSSTVGVEPVLIRQSRKTSAGDSSSVKLRTPKATSSAEMRLKMWRDARPSKSTQKKRQRKPKQNVANVWIIGSIYVKRGERAARQQFGNNFGLNAKVKWLGKGGMRWNGVLPRFYEEISSQRPPDVLVIHAGGNDLGLASAQELSSVMVNQLMQLHVDFPAMKIAFSTINERQSWRHGNPRRIDDNRRLINSTMRKAADSFGGDIIEHPWLNFYDSELFLRDGVHFTQRGNEVFLSSIHSAIKKILLNPPVQRT